MGTLPDALLRLIDCFSLGHKVFQSGDYKEEQLLAEFLIGPCLTIRHSDLASAAPVGQRGIRTFPGLFFTTLRGNMEHAFDAIPVGNWGSVSVSSIPACS